MDILGIIGIIISVFTTGISAAFFVVIKFNDMKHMEITLNDIKVTLAGLDKKLDGNSERIAKIEGKCSSNHG